MELKLHPDLKEPLKKLCDDSKTTIVVLSGSDRSVLDDVPLPSSAILCFRPLACYTFGLTACYAELRWLQHVAGSRKRDVPTSYNGRMDDNNARKFKYGLGRQRKGSYSNYITVFIAFGMNFICKLKFLTFVLDFSMFLSILLRERRGLILSFVKLHLYGTTSMQVAESLSFFLLLCFLFWLNLWYCYIFFSSIINLLPLFL